MKRFVSFLSAIILILTLPTTACAIEVSPRASEYFGFTDVRAYANGNGRVLIEIDIDATHKMDEVGASYVFIYEQQPNGSYEIVYTYTKEAYPSLIVENSYFGYVDVTYQGTLGTKYYALVGCYAKDSTGSETLYFDTNIVTA